MTDNHEPHPGAEWPGIVTRVAVQDFAQSFTSEPVKRTVSPDRYHTVNCSTIIRSDSP